METITQAREFNNETILIGEKEKKGMFSLISEEREYLWIFDFEQTKDVKISKINSAYVFTTSTAVYIYYKGAREIVKILDGVKILRIFDAQIFFNKEGKSYVLDLLRKEGK